MPINLNNVLKGVGNSDNIECQADLTVGDDLVVIDDATIGGDLAVTGTLAITGAAAFTAGLRTKQAVNNVHDTTPTAAECVTAFGTAASVGRGFIGTIDDADGDTNMYVVVASDASYYFLKFTKCS